LKTLLAAILCAVACALLAGAAPPPAPAPAVPTKQLPAEMLAPPMVKGEPAIKAGAAKALYAWADAKGVHVRWTSDGKPTLFAGAVEMDRAFAEGDLKRVNLLAGGWVQIHGDRLAMFSATARTEVDGFDLAVPVGALAKLFVEIDGQPATAEQVFFGEGLAHAKNLPVKFVVR